MSKNVLIVVKWSLFFKKVNNNYYKEERWLRYLCICWFKYCFFFEVFFIIYYSYYLVKWIVIEFKNKVWSDIIVYIVV